MAQRMPDLSVVVPLFVGLALIAGAALWQRSGIDEAEPRNLKAECDAGDAKSCFDLGMRVGSGEEGPKDLSRAHVLVDRACKLGLAEACEFLPLMKQPDTQ